MVRSAARATQTGGKARHPGPYQDNIPVLVARDRKGATFDAVLSQVDGASIGRALAGVVTQDNHLIGDGGRPIAAFARRAGIPFHAVLAPGKPAPAPHLHINNVNAYHGRLNKIPQPLQRRRHQELAKLSRLRRASRSLGRQTRTAKLDQRRDRKRTIPTANAIRAKVILRNFVNIKSKARRFARRRNRQWRRPRAERWMSFASGSEDGERRFRLLAQVRGHAFTGEPIRAWTLSSSLAWPLTHRHSIVCRSAAAAGSLATGPRF